MSGELRSVAKIGLALLISAAALACGDDGGGSGKDGGKELNADGSVAAPSDGGADAQAALDAAPTGSLADLSGHFIVRLQPAQAATVTTTATRAATSVKATLKDGSDPEALDLVETASEGDCKLLEPNTAFCDPKCFSGSVCTPAGVCEDQAPPTSAGAVTVSGLGEGPITLKLVNNTYQCAECGALAFPPCADGAPISIAVQGGAYPAFALEASCIAPLDVEGELTVETGKAVPITWTPAANATQTRIRMKLDISHHGGTRGTIECETDDDGSLEMAESLVTKLVALGFSGAPSLLVDRIAVGKATTAQPANVLMQVISSMEHIVEIPGLISCGSTDDCPPGKTCQIDLQCL